MKTSYPALTLKQKSDDKDGVINRYVSRLTWVTVAGALVLAGGVRGDDKRLVLGQAVVDDLLLVVRAGGDDSLPWAGKGIDSLIGGSRGGYSKNSSI